MLASSRVIFGIVAGGSLLGLHTDFDRNITTADTFGPKIQLPSIPNVTLKFSELPNNQWVGNWWIGIFACSILLMLWSIFVMPCVPRKFGKIEHGTVEKIDADSIGFFQALKDISRNKIWWLVTLSTTSDAIMVQSLQAFGIKKAVLTLFVTTTKISWIRFFLLS